MRRFPGFARTSPDSHSGPRDEAVRVRYPAPQVDRYDPREIRLRRRFERWFERLGVRAIHWGLDPLAGLLARPLELDEDLRPRPFIVALSGGVRSTGILNATSQARVRWAAELYRRGLAERLIVSGGPRRPGRPQSAPAMRDLAVSEGVPHDRVILEKRSSRTAENAADVAEVIRRNGAQSALLVTSPLHMRRAAACFSRHGIEIGPAPVRTLAGEEPERASLVAQVLHEYAGLFYYRYRGWL